MGRQTFLDIIDFAVRDAPIRFVDRHGTIVVGGRDAVNGASEPPVEIQVHRESFYGRVLRDSNLGLGESYIDEDFDIAHGSLESFLTILLRNSVSERIRGNPRLALAAAALRLKSTLLGKRNSVQRHYDLGTDLFESFLDPTLTYSCGYAPDPKTDLAALQQNKLDRICRKLRLQKGQHLLDIGCGFGGLLIFAAKHYGVRGVGISNSADHVRLARERVQSAGLADAIQIESGDYAEVKGSFDRIVSVGMMEHVPRREYTRYVQTFRRLLKQDGLALIHAIGCVVSRNSHDPFIQKYIFPGSNQPRLSEIARELERQAMPIHDVENLARHYFHTTRAWLSRWRENQSTLDAQRYPKRFRRCWEYYLCCCVAATQYTESALFQVLFARDYRSDVPLVRV